MIDHLNRLIRMAKTTRVMKNDVRFGGRFASRFGSRRFEIALLIGLMLIGPIMAFSYYSLLHLDEARKMQEHSRVVQDHLDELRSAVHDFEVRSLRPVPEKDREASHAKIDLILNDLSQSVENDEIQSESLVEVRGAISEFVADPTAARAKEVQEWIDSMDAQEVEYVDEHRPAAITFLSTASGSILIVGILSLFLSIIAFLGLRRQMRSREIIEDELRVAERQATLASEMKSKFLATISHELRTPLNGIIAMSDVLRESVTEKERRLADVIFQSSQNLLRIISDLLDFSQIESGQVGLEIEKISVREIVERTCQVLDLKAQSKNLKINAAVSESIPIDLYGDGGRLSQVLFNLIGNAIKFTEQGQIEVKVELDPASDSSVSRINFSVRDKGRGISEQDLGTLFQPFNRLGKVGTHGESGTGLGLSISQSLVRQMGGEIRTESRLGEGSVFWFQLPLKNAVDSALAGTKTRTTTSFSHLPNFSGTRVLVAEDNETNQIVAQTVLEQFGCQVFLAANGAEAVELIERSHFDLVLMDCQMPVLDGYEATRRIRARESIAGGASIRIAAMTANAQSDDRAKCLASGMDDYISKPITIQELVRVLSGSDLSEDWSSVEAAVSALTTRFGPEAAGRLKAAFARSLAEWPLDARSSSLERSALSKISHKLKSSARAVGANSFANRLEKLETMLEKLDSASLDQNAIHLKSEADRDVRILKRLFAA